MQAHGGMDGTVHMWRRRESSALQRAVPAGQGRSHWIGLRMASGLADAALRARAGGRSDERLRWRRRCELYESLFRKALPHISHFQGFTPKNMG